MLGFFSCFVLVLFCVCCVRSCLCFTVFFSFFFALCCLLAFCLSVFVIFPDAEWARIALGLSNSPKQEYSRGRIAQVTAGVTVESDLSKRQVRARRRRRPNAGRLCKNIMHALHLYAAFVTKCRTTLCKMTAGRSLCAGFRVFCFCCGFFWWKLPILVEPKVHLFCVFVFWWCLRVSCFFVDFAL